MGKPTVNSHIWRQEGPGHMSGGPRPSHCATHSPLSLWNANTVGYPKVHDIATHLGSQLQSTSCLSSWSLADTKLSFCDNHVAELRLAIQFCMVPFEKHGTVYVLGLAAQHGNEQWLQEHILSSWVGSLSDWKQHTLSHGLQAVSVLLKNLWGRTDRNSNTMRCATRSLQLASLFVHCLCSLNIFE